ncbi:MAG: 30S ribosomal protein S9 [Candidatus Aenigmarchaeota archaeon]|nr:30S ribosomal protein S9 [Candidatus Aenigmarchaeota archaeon]
MTEKENPKTEAKKEKTEAKSHPKEEKHVKEAPKKEVKKPKKVPTPKKEKPKEEKQGKNVIFTVGKRKVAVARCTIRPGVGRILVNSTPVELIQSEVVRLMVSEPMLILGNDKWKAYDFDINLSGGGVMGQAEAARQSIARGLVELFGNEVKAIFLEYNRAFLAYDPRRTEPHKSPRSSQGPRRYKQRSKR